MMFFVVVIARSKKQFNQQQNTITLNDIICFIKIYVYKYGIGMACDRLKCCVECWIRYGFVLLFGAKIYILILRYAMPVDPLLRKFTILVTRWPDRFPYAW